MTVKKKNTVPAKKELRTEHSRLFREPAENSEIFRIEDDIRFLYKLGNKQMPRLSKKDVGSFMREKGITADMLRKFMKYAQLSLSEIASILRTSERTLNIYRPNQSFNPAQSEHILLLARLYHFSEEIFNDAVIMNQWMDQPNEWLDDKKPKELVDTILGIDVVLNNLRVLRNAYLPGKKIFGSTALFNEWMAVKTTYAQGESRFELLKSRDTFAMLMTQIEHMELIITTNKSGV